MSFVSAKLRPFPNTKPKLNTNTNALSLFLYLSGNETKDSLKVTVAHKPEETWEDDVQF